MDIAISEAPISNRAPGSGAITEASTWPAVTLGTAEGATVSCVALVSAPDTEAFACGVTLMDPPTPPLVSMDVVVWGALVSTLVTRSDPANSVFATGELVTTPEAVDESEIDTAAFGVALTAA